MYSSEEKSDRMIPVFVSKAGAISADPELSQELPKALFNLTALHDPFIPGTFSSAEAVAIINSGIVKSRHCFVP